MDILDMEKRIKKGDILIYLGDVEPQVGIVKEVCIDGLVKVKNGKNLTLVAPINFVELIPATEKSIIISNM